MLFSYQNATNSTSYESELQFWAPFIAIAASTVSTALLFHYCKHKGYCPEGPLINAVPVNTEHGTTWLSTSVLNSPSSRTRLLSSGETDTEAQETISVESSVERARKKRCGLC